MSEHIKNNHADFEQIVLLIQEARSRVYAKANAELVLLYFNVGKTVSEKVTAGKWGENTVQELANFIAAKLPPISGFNRRGLYRMKQFYETYGISSECFLLWLSIRDINVSPLATHLQSVENKENKKGSALPTKIKKAIKEKVSPAATLLEMHNNFLNDILLKVSWTNHLEIFSSTKKAEEMLFYTLMSLKENWKKEEVRRQIKTASFERTMLSKQQNNMLKAVMAQLPQNLFKDPYIFEFLDLPDNHSELDLEKAIIKNLQKFILEVGKGFTYMGNQYRLQVGNKDYYTDLLFFHRDLQCLVLFELKIEDFAPEFLGKLNFYLEALDRDVKRPNENPSIGILLCKGKDTEVVEYAMARNTSPAIIADYETKLIDKKLLAEKLQQLAEIFEKANKE
jgi:predicted nuclease of restriction endonuclease-like (RecB) superfamily